MNRITLLFTIVAVTCVHSQLSTTRGDTIGAGANAFQIQFVTVGNPGNPADNTGLPNPAGSVSYEYRIGKYEISRSMIEKANAEAPLGIGLADMTAYGGNAPDKPATGVSWFDAARFVNYLNISTGHMPAYKFDGNNDFQLWQPGDQGYDANNLFRNSNAFYFLPSVDEWYKAAFYDPSNGVYWDYPTGSNGGLTPVASGTLPNSAVFLQDLNAGPANITQAGALSPYGTMAQGGNVGEWDESAQDLTNNNSVESRGARGGFWESTQSGLSVSGRSSGNPSAGYFDTAFRVASIVPEPNTLMLVVVSTFLVLQLRIAGARRR